MMTAAVAVLALYAVEREERVRTAAAAERERMAQLDELAENWALQRTLQALSGTSAPKKTPAEIRAEAATLLAEARAALGVTPPRQERSNIDGITQYVRSPNTRLAATLLSIAKRGSVALLVISILLALAIFLVPFVKSLTEIGEAKGKGVFDSDSERDSGAPAKGSLPPLVLPTSNAGAFQQETGQSAAAIPLGTAARVAPLLVPTVIAAGAVIMVGTILINVTGREASISPDVRLPNVGLHVDDFQLAVRPGIVEVPSSRIVPSQPVIDADTPTLQFHFPASRVEQAALTALTSELREYRSALSELARNDARIVRQQEELERLIASNAALSAELQLRPTEEKVAELITAVTERNVIERELQSAVVTLADATKQQSTAVAAQRTGERVAALQYARQLNAQNQKLINQIFRPGVVVENCRTYASVMGEVRGLPDCTGPWLRDKLTFWSRGTDVADRVRIADGGTSPEDKKQP